MYARTMISLFYSGVDKLITFPLTFCYFLNFPTAFFIVDVVIHAAILLDIFIPSECLQCPRGSIFQNSSHEIESRDCSTEIKVCNDSVTALVSISIRLLWKLSRTLFSMHLHQQALLEIGGIRAFHKVCMYIVLFHFHNCAARMKVVHIYRYIQEKMKKQRKSSFFIFLFSLSFLMCVCPSTSFCN